MESVSRARIFSVPSNICFQRLQIALEANQCKILAANDQLKEVIASWSVGLGARYTLQSHCDEDASGNTVVTLTYRPDLTPARSRPMGKTTPDLVTEKLEMLLSSLGMYVDPNVDQQQIAEHIRMEAATRKQNSKRRLIMIAVLSVGTGALMGFSTHAFTVRGLSTFLISTLLCWIIFALIWRAIWK